MLLSDFPVSMASAKLVGSFYIINTDDSSIDLSSYDYGFIYIEIGDNGVSGTNTSFYLTKNSSIFFANKNTYFYIFRIQNNNLQYKYGYNSAPTSFSTAIPNCNIYFFKYI